VAPSVFVAVAQILISKLINMIKNNSKDVIVENKIALKM
jgi:hypothetical protein